MFLRLSRILGHFTLDKSSYRPLNRRIDATSQDWFVEKEIVVVMLYGCASTSNDNL